MTAPTHVEIVLVLAGSPQPICGDVRCADGSAIAFRGWLELAAAIERARLAAQPG